MKQYLFIKLLLLPSFCLLPILCLGQQHVTGIVTDAVTHTPLPGATIGIKGTSAGVIADATGKFSLSVSHGQTIEVRTIGYQPLNIPYRGQATLLVQLHPSSTVLNQLVVVGYGTQAKSTLTSSVSSISAKEIQKQTTGNVASALQGRAPGVEILQQGGIAGGDVNIVIRGAGSFGVTSPLVVIDGAFSTTGLTSLNPQDIESIEVLKDAAAAAIYGSRASNGVILVTTKKGKHGPPSVEVNASYSFQTPIKRLDYMNAEQWRKFANQVADNSGIAHAPENDKPTDPSVNTNWQNLMFQYAPIYNVNTSISGGGKNATYRASLGYFDQTGMIVTSLYKRYNMRINSRFKKNRLQVDEDLAISYKHKTPTPEMLLNVPLPTMPAYKNGSLFSGGPEYYIDGNIKTNPLALPFYEEAYTDNTEILGNIKLNYEIFDGLTYSINLAGSYNESHGFTHVPQYSTRSLPDGEPDPNYGNDVNSISESRGDEFDYNIDNLLTYKKSFNKSNTDFLIGTSWLKELSRSESIATTPDLGGPNITGVNGEGNIGAQEADDILLSLFSRLNYNYGEKYLFSASLRRDESSKFSKNNRVGYFPSISAGWNISRENFFHSNIISSLKLRASYGELGANFIDPYGFNSLAYGPIPAVFGATQQRIYGRVFYLADQGIKWETSISKDAGIDVGLLNDDLTFSLDYFIKTNKDLLASLELTPSSGQTIVINDGFEPVVNSASVENKGVEFVASYVKKINQNFTVNATVNMSGIRNKVLELGQNVQPIRGNLISGSFNDRPTITEKGLPIGSFIGYKVTGIDDQGNFVFQGEKDGTVDENDKVILGNPIPKFTYGLNISTKYRNFDLTLFVQGVQGNKIFNQTRINQYFEYDHDLPVNVLNAWTPDNRKTNIPIMNRSDEVGGNSLPSSFYIENGSYMRLKNIQIGYSFGRKFLSRKKMNTLRIYAGAQNLLIITKYSGYDPEVSSDVLFNRGVDFNSYPNAIVVTAGFSADF